MHRYFRGKRFVGILAAILFLIFAVPYILDAVMPSDKWAISEDGIVSYPENRGSVEYSKTVLNDTQEFMLSKIIYTSKGENIYALLRVPKTPEKRKPAIILLPGAQVTKEGEDSRAAKFAEWGYVTLTIDERGNRGETKSGIVSFEDEYAKFLENTEPMTHKMIFDVLRAFDFLKEQDYVDSKNIIVFGESMGGRFAIMAAAAEPRISGAIGVSTSGYGSPKEQIVNANVTRFFNSIDPDNYIAKIAPRRVLLVHSANDSVIPIDMARKTFNYAKEPKAFAEVACKTHGWCIEMEPVLKEELGKFFSGN